MKLLEFTLSDFSSLQKQLIQQFNFLEVSNNYFQSLEIKNQQSFFKRIFIESGFEVWILSAYFSENIILKQNQSHVGFNAIHIMDFDGLCFRNDFFKMEFPAKGVYLTEAEIDLSFQVKAFERINLVSIIFSKRWTEINLSSLSNYQDLFKNYSPLRKYPLEADINSNMINIMNIIQTNEDNTFLLKINIFSLFRNILNSMKTESVIEKITKFTLNDLVLLIEDVLNKDFETPICSIYDQIQKNGFDKNEFIKLFKERNQKGLYQYRQLKKMEFALGLLDEGYKIKEISKRVGFKSQSKFIEFFKSEYSDTPYRYSKSTK